MTIYLDVVLIENLIMNYIIFFTEGLVAKKKIKHIRLILASLLGAVYSIIAYSNILKVYSKLILKIILSIILVYIAYNPKTFKRLSKDVLLFYLISFAFGGAAFSAIYIIKPQEILMKNGLFLGMYPIKTIILGAGIAFIVITIGFTIAKNKIVKKDIYCRIEFKLNNQEITTTAMLDTGNLLKEPITNTPVVVIEHTLLYQCMPKEILNNLEKIIGGDFEKIPEQIKNEYISRLKLIPFSSLGKENGMLIGIKPEYIKIKTEELEEIKENVILGIYNKSLTKKGEYRALMGIEII